LAKGVGVSITDIVRDTFHNAVEDDLAGEAAKMAYFFFLSLFPLILVVFALTGIVGGKEAFTQITNTAESVVPDYAWQFVREVIREITDRSRPGVLSFGIVLTIWAASNGIAALTGGLNSMYDLEETRPWWQRRLLALVVMVATVSLLVLGTAVFVKSTGFPNNEDVSLAWKIAQWPVGFAALTGIAWLAYTFLPARDRHDAYLETLAGAVVASLLWVGASLIFRLYVANFSRYSSTYGAVGAVIVLLIWFYLTALAMLIGGELAATLEGGRHRSRRS
jgi:membrane protein